MKTTNLDQNNSRFSSPDSEVENDFHNALQQDKNDGNNHTTTSNAAPNGKLENI